eukprot:g7208.t1
MPKRQQEVSGQKLKLIISFTSTIMWLQSWHNNDNLHLCSRLAEGVEEEMLDFVEGSLGLVLPLDVKEVYRIHNGQNIPYSARSFDIDTIIEKSEIDTSQTMYHSPSEVGGLFIATPILLDLETGFNHTIELRDHYNQVNRILNLTKQRKLKEKQQGGVTNIDVIYSSIVYAEISWGSLKQLLLLKCDTHDVYLWEYPSHLVHIPSKSKYGWFAIWLEGLTGFDENGNPCQVPLSWYLIWDGEKCVPLQDKDCKKVKKQITLSGVKFSCDGFDVSRHYHFRFSVTELIKKDILLPENCGLYRVPQLCSIASKISKPLMCHVFSRLENDVMKDCTTIDKPEWFITICFESVESSEDSAIDSSQDTVKK